jgi:hypothetical protein
MSIDAEKASDKTQHPFMIKALKKLEVEGTYLNIIKTILRKTETISSQIRNEKRVSTLPSLIQFSARILTTIRQEKERKEIQIGKKSNYPYSQII